MRPPARRQRGRVAQCLTWTAFVIVSLCALASMALLIEQLTAGNIKLAERVTPVDHSHVSDGSTGLGLPPPSPPSPPPPPTGVQVTDAHLAAVSATLDATIQPDYTGGNQLDPPLKHAYGMIGNAFSGSELIVGRGERARGVAAQTGDYVRWSAFTQIVAAVAVMKAVEEGILGYDDEVRQYLPEMDSANLRQLKHDPLTGLPNGTQAVVVQTTVRHLATFRSGQTYLLWRQGLYLLPGLFGDTATDEEYIWNAYPEVATKMATGVVSSGDCPSSDESLLATIAMPLSHAPGRVPRLGNGYAIMGAVLAGALRAKNHTHRSASAYIRARVLGPLGMADTWFARTEDPPADVESRLAEAFLMRMAEPAQVNEGYMDPNPRNGVPSDYTYGAASSFFQPVWMSDVPGDSYYCMAQGSYLAPGNVSNDKYGASGIETSMTGTLADMGKFVRMIIREGVTDDGMRVLSRQSVHFMLQPTTDPTTEELRYLQGGGEFGYALPGDYSYALAGDVPRLAENLHYPISDGTYTYTTHYGLTILYDVRTGNYAVMATSVPSNADGMFAVREKRLRTRELFAIMARS